MPELPDENTKLFVAILNKKHPVGQLMNALGHIAAGLAGGSGLQTDMCFLQYQDKDTGTHPNISHFPFIVLKADNSNQIRKIRAEAIARNISFSDFTTTMTIGTSEEQQNATAATPESELEYLAIVLFGETAILKTFTGKFSLYN